MTASAHASNSIITTLRGAVTATALLSAGCHLVYPFGTQPAAVDSAADSTVDASQDRGPVADASTADARMPDLGPDTDKPDAPASPCLDPTLFSSKWVCMGGGGQCYATCGGYTLDCYPAPTACTCSIPGGKVKSCPAVVGSDCDRCQTSLANGCCAP